LNTRPLLYGVRRHGIMEEIDLVEDYPAHLAQMLLDDKIDIGLIPVGVLPRLGEWIINGSFCIGCNGPVASVCLFSEAPMEDIDTVYLDYQSRTSVLLAQVLLKEYWKKEVKIIRASSEEYLDQIKGRSAGVVIGDRALRQRQRSSRIFDLGEAWKAHTGLPFVFAAWISRRPLDPAFIQRFNEANALGLRHIPEVIAENPYPHYDLEEYFTKNIDYVLDEEKRKGLELFLGKLGREW
jgi:chorismate dehydratase